MPVLSLWFVIPWLALVVVCQKFVLFIALSGRSLFFRLIGSQFVMSGHFIADYTVVGLLIVE